LKEIQEVPPEDDIYVNDKFSSGPSARELAASLEATEKGTRVVHIRFLFVLIYIMLISITFILITSRLQSGKGGVQDVQA
jgi:hypothetical protein